MMSPNRRGANVFSKFNISAELEYHVGKAVDCYKPYFLSDRKKKKHVKISYDINNLILPQN